MENIQKMEPRFGDDYIPLLLSDEELTRVREKSTSDRTQRTKMSTRESLLSNTVDHISSTIEEKIQSACLVILPISQMGLQMDDVRSEDVSTFNTSTRSNLGKEMQIVDQRGVTAMESLQSTTKSLPSPIAQVIASTLARRRELLRPRALPSPLRETVFVKLDACEVNSSARQACISQPKQSSNEALMNDDVRSSSRPQPRRLAASDLIKVDKIQLQGNPNPAASPAQHSPEP
jgi:hypothetical protein